MMKRQSSVSSLTPLQREPDLDSCCSDSDVFDPPAWRPGRFLQFADILSVEDESSVRPVSLLTERLGLHGLCSAGFENVQSSGSGCSPLVIQMESGHMSSRHWRLFSRQTIFFVTASVAVAFTALTFLSFVLRDV